MKYLVSICLLLLIFGTQTSCRSFSKKDQFTTDKDSLPRIHFQPFFRPYQMPTFKTGAENYTKYIPLLENKKIGIVTNQTSVLKLTKSITYNKDKNSRCDQEIIEYSYQSIVDFFLSKNIKIQTIFAPEHGFRGTADAGEHLTDGKDTQTGLPIISLYGDNKKPKPELLTGIDLMVFDLQDVGTRFYTYISTLHYVMESCAENNVPLIILDRPNPNCFVVDGPILEKEYTRFAGMHPVPVLYGMTIGEYAQMINGEKWLKNGIKCKLTIIPCTDYNRFMSYDLTIKPSPNLPNEQSINLYASLCPF